MNKRKPLPSEEISALVNCIADEFESEERAEMDMLAKLPPDERWLAIHRKSEAIRSDLRDKLMEDFPEFSPSEINMTLLRSLTPVQMGKSYTEPAHHEYFG